MKLQEYLQVLTEARTAKQLPRDLVSSLTKKGYDVDEIQMTHDHEIKFTKKIRDKKLWKTSDRSQEAIDELAEWAQRKLDFIDKHDLFCIFSYGDGDYAYFSFKNKMIYDWSHEGGEFYGMVSPKIFKMRKPIHYKKWLEDYGASQEKPRVVGKQNRMISKLRQKIYARYKR